MEIYEHLRTPRLMTYNADARTQQLETSLLSNWETVTYPTTPFTQILGLCTKMSN